MNFCWAKKENIWCNLLVKVFLNRICKFMDAFRLIIHPNSLFLVLYRFRNNNVIVAEVFLVDCIKRQSKIGTWPEVIKLFRNHGMAVFLLARCPSSLISQNVSAPLSFIAQFIQAVYRKRREISFLAGFQLAKFVNHPEKYEIQFNSVFFTRLLSLLGLDAKSNDESCLWRPSLP